jgi:hypothetical protein
MNFAEVTAIYAGSNGEATKALYARLEAVGLQGVIALNLFRASKCSDRAKVYRGRNYKGAAYDRKNWSMENLCKVLAADDQTFVWGWGIDDKARAGGSPHHHVLYLETPRGQVSFHSDHRGEGPDYAGAWDGFRGTSALRICQFCSDLLTPAEENISPEPVDNRAEAPH